MLDDLAPHIVPLQDVQPVLKLGGVADLHRSIPGMDSTPVYPISRAGANGVPSMKISGKGMAEGSTHSDLLALYVDAGDGADETVGGHVASWGIPHLE